MPRHEQMNRLGNGYKEIDGRTEEEFALLINVASDGPSTYSITK